MGLFALLARFLPRRERMPQFAYVPVAPTRLERRRVLDAAGAGLALEAIPDAQPFVQTASMTTAEESLDQQDVPATIHGGPHATIRLRDAELFEDQSTLAVVNISDNFPMAHQVTIDWGDGSAATVINAGANQRDVLAVHRFLDDPAGPGDGSYTVTATVINTLGETTTTSTTILVKNVAPKIDSLAINSPINENGTATLTGTYSDAGTLDTHTLDIDWNGDGTFDQSVTVTGGTFSVSRQILDDNPTGTTSDTFNVNVRLRDDDGGEATGAVPLTVSNVSPTITGLSITSPIIENGTATLTGTYFDGGTQDTHELDIDWNGDGTFDQTVAVSGGNFIVSREYLDDNPTGTNDTFNVVVRLSDDDGGSTVAAVVLTVQNANPIVTLDPDVISIFENGTAVLSGTYTDSGTQDTHELDIDWDGDGTFDETVAVAGGAFTVTRQFLDDNPTGTRFDKSIVTVRLRDDDGGVSTDTASLEVRNANPAVALVPPSAIVENGIATLNGTITDIGTLDTFTLLVNWGDPASPDDLQTFDLGTTALTKAVDGIDWDPVTRQFSVDHQYLDDNPTGSSGDTYDILVGVVDDDTGAAVARTSVTVQNAAPVLANVAITSPIVENGTATLTGTYTDLGTQDSHELDIDWDGDGTFDETVAVSGGGFSVSHQFLDDNPTGTASDTFNVNMRLRDDDDGAALATTSVEVINVGPDLVLVPPSSIDENQAATLNGTITDVGTLDTFKLSVNWGDSASPNNVQTFELGTTTLTKAVDGIDWDPITRQFSIDHQYLDDNPTATSSDTYDISVIVIDDDTGADFEATFITVQNVAALLTVADQTVDEGSTLDLNGGLLGTFVDQGTRDTHTATVNWGDGSSDQSVVLSETNGSGNLGASHIYADNGVYTVTVTITDDDGGSATETFEVTVVNVDPLLFNVSIDHLVIKEGEDVNLSGMFSDVGFDNPNNPSGPSQENLRFEIDWDDDPDPEVSDVLVVTPGGEGRPTEGSFTVNHVYADNDEDNLYTITVKILDDDGGVSVAHQIEVKVLNVNPTLEFVAATDITTGGIATFTLTFDDPGTEPLTVHIDWGDGVPRTYTFQPSATEITHTFEHRYERPPNPTNPAAPITIRAYVTDDDFGILGMVEPGISDEVSAVITSPGIGAEPFRIDTTPRVPQLAFPVREVPLFVANSAGATFTTQQTFIIGGSAGETPTAAYRYFELRVIDAEGNESEGYPLPPNVLEDLPGLFRTLPDNHYAIYVVNTETNVPRLVIEVYVRNGKMIDPGDDSEGTRDRPPTDEQQVEPAATVPAEGAPVTLPAEDGPTNGDQVAAPVAFPARYSRWTALAVGLAASSSAQSWAHRVDQALAKATAEQWRKLQGYNPPKPKKS